MGQEITYAKAGVDTALINKFEFEMQKVARETRHEPERRGVIVSETGSFHYLHTRTTPHCWHKITEGLGNKNWIAEWMYLFTKDPRWFAGIGIDTGMMAVVDLLRHGALPVGYNSKVSVGSSDWFGDDKRNHALACSFAEFCRMAQVALLGGESASIRFIMPRAEPPVAFAPDFSGDAFGIIAPSHREITARKLRPGSQILGAVSTGIHSNGISLVIDLALKLKNKFLHVLPGGDTVGAEALIPTANYVPLVEGLLDGGVEILGIVPVTGDGVAKLLRDSRSFTYRIKNWVEVPKLMRFALSLGVSPEECLRTFNWGIGMFFFVPERSADRAVAIARNVGQQLFHLGRVEVGQRKIIFEPEKIELLPKR